MTKFIKLTKTSGSPIVLNIGDITTVSEAANQFGAEPSTQITLGGSVNKNYLHVKESMEKIALFCSMPKDGVISLPNLETIYQVPLFLAEEGIDKILTKRLQLDKTTPNP